MDNTQALVVLVIVVVIGVVAGGVRIVSRRKRLPESRRREELRQDLRRKVLYDEAKIDRLIEFERDELKRKGQPEETIEDLMGRAIERWERDNAGAAPLY